MTTKDTKNARQTPSRESSALQRRTQTRGPNPSQEHIPAQKQNQPQGQNPATATASGPPPYIKLTGPWVQKCAIIISMIPCGGKTSAKQNVVAYLKEKKLPVPWTFHDLDSAKYYQKKTPEWLEYYVDTIKKTAQLRYAIIFVSAHAKVQETLLGEGVKFMRVRPRRGAKEIYLKRERERPSHNEGLNNYMNQQWGPWHDFEEKMDKYNRAIVLGNDQYLSDAIIFVLRRWKEDLENGGTERYAAGKMDLEEVMGIKGMS